MSSQDGQQNEQNQISPHNQSAKTTAGAIMGSVVIPVCEYAWDGIKALWEVSKEKTADSKQKEEKNCNEKPVIEDCGNQQTKGKVDGKQEPKAEKTNANNQQTTDDKQVKQEPKAQDQSQGNNPIIAALKGTGPSNNQGRPPSAMPSNNNSPFVGRGRG